MSEPVEEYPRRTYHKVQFWAELLAGMTVSMAVVLLVGGAERTSAPAYRVITENGPLIWGLMFFVTGILTIVCARWCHGALRWALLGQAIPYAALGFSFAITAVQHPDSTLTAAPLYAWIVVLHAFLADFSHKELP